MPNNKNTVDRNQNKRQYRSMPIGHMLKIRGDTAPDLNKKLNDELLLCYNKIRLSEQEIECRNSVFETLKKVLEDALECTVESHGSFRTNMMVFDSDIDITVIMNKSTGNVKDELVYKPYANQILSRIATIIEESKITTGPILHIKHARVPIVKCTDKKYGCKIDILIDRKDNVECADFVIEQVKIRPYLKYIVTLLKYFLKRRQLSEVIRGGLCSYAQFLMILNFVQLHPLIQNDNIVVEDNLGTILMDFFQFYGVEFPFERAVISVVDKRYKQNRDSQIFIEDPCNPGHNVAGGCTSLPLIREIFKFSYKIMAAAFEEKVATNRAIGELWLRLDGREERKNTGRK